MKNALLIILLLSVCIFAQEKPFTDELAKEAIDTTLIPQPQIVTIDTVNIVYEYRSMALYNGEMFKAWGIGYEVRTTMLVDGMLQATSEFYGQEGQQIDSRKFTDLKAIVGVAE